MQDPIRFAPEHAEALHEIYTVAADIAAGNGGPARYRVHPADTAILTAAFGRREVKVGVIAGEHGPVAAMCLAGFILYGLEFEYMFAKVGIAGDLDAAFRALAQRFGPRERVSLQATPCSAPPALGGPGAMPALGERPAASGGLVSMRVERPGTLGHTARPVLESAGRLSLPDFGGRRSS